ncbi:MAG: hypothetical protein ACYTF8_14725 [Planctomycetota bacterium]
MWRRFAKYLAIVAGLVCVFMLAVQLWLGGYEREFEARLDAIRQAGEPLEFADLAYPPIPDEQNAAILFAEAAAWLDGQDDWCPCNLDSEDSLPRTEEERLRCHAYLETLEPYYELLKRVPTRPGWSVPHREGDEASNQPQASWMFSAAEYLRHRVELDPRDEGRTKRASEAALLLLDLGDRWQIPMGIGYLMDLTTKSSAGWILLAVQAKPGFDARLFRRLMDARLAAAEPKAGPPARILREERLFGLSAVRRWLAGERIEFLSKGRRPLLRHTWIGRPFVYRDAVRYLDVIDAAIPLCDKTPEEAVDVAAELAGRNDGVDVLTARMQEHLPRLFSWHTRTAASIRLTRVVMALLEYRQRHQAWPETLQALGPLPLDPFTGRPFVYERRAAGVRIHAAPGATQDWGDLECRGLAWSWEE